MAKDERFIKAYKQGNLNVTEIWVDIKTGVNYIFHSSNGAGGLTPLIDKNGNITISNEDEIKFLANK